MASFVWTCNMPNTGKDGALHNLSLIYLSVPVSAVFDTAHLCRYQLILNIKCWNHKNITCQLLQLFYHPLQSYQQQNPVFANQADKYIEEEKIVSAQAWDWET